MTVKLYDYSRSKKIAEIDVKDPAPPTLSYAGKGWHRFGGEGRHAGLCPGAPCLASGFVRAAGSAAARSHSSR